jgi:hypothetical protein
LRYRSLPNQGPSRPTEGNRNIKMVNRIAGMECSIKIEHKADRLRIQRFGIVSAMYFALEDDRFRLMPSAITQ